MDDSRERIRGPPRDGREGLTSPRQVLRRLMMLSEGRQYREAAGVIGRLGPSVLRSVVAELPIDILVEALPHSAYLLESFFSRLTIVNPSPRPEIPVDVIIWQLVKIFGNYNDQGLKQRCSKLIQSLVQWQPNLRRLLQERSRSLDQAIQGLGIHGLTADSTGTLVSLHIALKEELQRHIDTYKTAIHKLEELSDITVNQEPANSSHQRLLAINYSGIQQRLIDNKTILTILDKPVLRQLQQLIENLSVRVQKDKEVLQCVGQIKRLDPQPDIEKRPAAGMLMNFSRGCELVIGLMGPITKPSSPSSGSCCSDGYYSDSDFTFEDQKNETVRLYRYLYTNNRADTLNALNCLPQLKHANSLKAKILFSIIVLSFRACNNLRERKVMEVIHGLHCSNVDSSNASLSLERAVRLYLNQTSEAYPMDDIERQVATQVLSTLHEYPCLETCSPLIKYVSSCVRLAWKMVNQTPPYYLDNDFTLGFIQSEKHERHPQSDQKSSIIRSFLWPALLQNSHCVFKAVVTT